MQHTGGPLWNFAHVLRDDGLSYMAYGERSGVGATARGCRFCSRGCWAEGPAVHPARANGLGGPCDKTAAPGPTGQWFSKGERLARRADNAPWRPSAPRDGAIVVVHESWRHSLAGPPATHYSMVMTNPPFGKKSSITIVAEDGGLEKEDSAYERQDFWVTTKNKQLNFLQHVRTLLKVNGRCAIVVPDNVLFEGGAGETVRRNLMQQCDVHTLLRLPTCIFYAQGVKANVLFFDARPAQEKAWTKKLWVYDLRTNMHFTLKQNPLMRADLDEFVRCHRPANRQRRKPTWSEQNADGRWRVFDYEELIKRDKVNLDLFWLRDKSLEDGDDLPEPRRHCRGDCRRPSNGSRPVPVDCGGVARLGEADARRSGIHRKMGLRNTLDAMR